MNYAFPLKMTDPLKKVKHLYLFVHLTVPGFSTQNCTIPIKVWKPFMALCKLYVGLQLTKI